MKLQFGTTLRQLRRIMAETWMQSLDFDGLRETPRFRAVLEALQTDEE